MKKQSILCILIISLVFLCSCSNDSLKTSKDNISYKEALQVDYKTLNNTNAVLMFKSSSNNTEVGELYIKPYNEDEEKIASNVYMGQYILLNNNDVAYIDASNNLYLKKYGQEVEKIDKNVPFDSVYISSKNAICYRTYEKENFLEANDSNYKDILLDNKGNTYVLYDSEVKNYDGDNYYYFSDNGEFLYCLNTFDTLLKIDLEGKTTNLAGNVNSFTVTQDGSATAYTTFNNRLYIKWSGTEKSSYIDNLEVYDNYKLSNNGLSCIFVANDDNSYDNLMFVTPFSKPITIMKSVYDYKVDVNNEYLYALDENSNLYGYKLPSVTAKANPDDLTNQLDKLDKVLIGKDIIDYVISHDGKSVSYINSNNELYTSYELAEAIKVQNNINSIDYINDAIVFYDENSNLYINDAYNDMVKVLSSNKEISSNSQYFYVENNSLDYFIYMDENSDIYTYSTKEKAKLIIDNAKEYNSIQGRYVNLYVKSLSIDNVKGLYSCENNSNEYDTFAIDITEDYITLVFDDYISKKDITIVDSTETSITISDSEEYTYSFYQYEGNLSLEIYDIQMDSYYQYKIEKITSDKYNEKYDEAKLEMKYNTVYYLIEDYYRNNYLATEALPLYYERSIESLIIGHTIVGEEYYVLDYYVEDDYNFWLYIEFLNSEGVDYAWIYIDTSNFTIEN